MNDVIHIGSMKLEFFGKGGIWLSNDDDKHLEITPQLHAKLEELLKEFFDKHIGGE